jgi:hypothetical protein
LFAFLFVDKNQSLSPFAKQLEILPIDESLPKNGINDKTTVVSNESEKSPKKTETNKSSTPHELKPKLSPKELNELIKDIFLFEMPEDFFYFWQFCKTLKPEKPEGIDH